ncbi:hypothetical protein [Nocardia caishijiensis]|uniref:ABC transporter permease n=1 Tax=Nocardia caishijiensis TaxID=184756 RepID=A0ABQ6YH25_9NOCA|nr:hypothetical protein [Nocardia caishijiensis]KAF0844804.1 hypothetical protein FNL39_11036 [Nocardia caishijiensis]
MATAISALSATTVAQGAEGGGAALDQVALMTGAAVVVGAVLLWVAFLHRTRRITWLQRLADFSGRVMNRPGWVALPIAMFLATILTAFLGFIWDVSLHVGKGRDAGPLANPAHYFILVGLFFLFMAGMLAVVLPLDEKPGRAAVRITREWYAPVGGILIAGAGLYALIGFPLDDIWHRLFGQDVTLWGPTHLMLIGGAGLSLVGVLLLELEGRYNRPDPGRTDGRVLWAVRAFAFGGLVIGLSVFGVEFDFGVQQFRLVLQPMLIVFAATIALISARLTLGPFSALLLVAFAFAVRSVVAVLVGTGFEAPRNVFPLYLGAAVVVELSALTPLIRRPLWWGALTGLGVATVGIWLESLWVERMFVNPWVAGMWPELLAMAVPVGVAGGVIGAMLGTVLRGEALPTPAVRRGLVVIAVVIAAAATTNGLVIRVPEHASATVVLTDAEPVRGGRMVTADIRFTPADLVGADPEWVEILSWQGGTGDDSPGHGLVVDILRRVDDDHFVSNRPVPVHGTWKTVLRLQDGRRQAALPIFLPHDPGIGAAEVSAPATFTRPFVEEISVLQRERSFDHPSWLFGLAGLVVLACSLALISAMAWGAARVNDRYRAAGSTPDQEAAVAT